MRLLAFILIPMAGLGGYAIGLRVDTKPHYIAPEFVEEAIVVAYEEGRESIILEAIE